MVYETTNSVSTSYVLAGNKLISQTQSGSTSFYLQDGQGSTRTLTNSAGDVTDTYAYTAFGEIYSQTGTTANSYLYTGQQYDFSSGLYSLRARFYNPAVGRFLSQDTFAVNFNNPIELNRYVYAANRAVNASDPSGQAIDVGYAIGILKSLGSAMRDSAPIRAFVSGSIGAVIGAISAAVCGGNPAFGAAVGFAMGAVGAFLPIPLASTISVVGGAVGLAAGFEDYKRNGMTLCNFIAGVSSVIAIGGGFASGFGGFGGGLQPVFAGNNGGGWSGSTQAIVGSIVGSVSSTTALSGAAGLVSMMSGGGGKGGGNDDVWEYTDPETGKEYKVGPYNKVRPQANDDESHHGVMSRWMRAIFGNKYNEGKAPAVRMPEADHHKTFGVYTNWRAQMAQQQGVSYRNLNWRLITESQMRQLGQEMFDAAQVPQIVRDQYWSRFNIYFNSLNK